MSKQQRGLGKGLGALLGGDADLSQIRKPVGYVNKEVVSASQPRHGRHPAHSCGHDRAESVPAENELRSGSS